MSSQGYFDNLLAKTGIDAQDFKKLAGQEGLLKKRKQLDGVKTGKIL